MKCIFYFAKYKVIGIRDNFWQLIDNILRAIQPTQTLDLLKFFCKMLYISNKYAKIASNIAIFEMFQNCKISKYKINLAQLGVEPGQLGVGCRGLR